MDLITLYVYAYIAVLPLLSAGAFYYTYRIRKVSGAFRGWDLLLVFAFLLWIQGMGTFVGGATTALFNSSQLPGYIAKVGQSTLASNLTLSLLSSATLFVAMFEIYGAFRHVYATKENAVPQIAR